ncbi:hypothetical protein Q3G72_017935 [Acer saccharum]|nr:hypothetical protein Q3G72_017935 [Acer saccharum]
MGFNIGKKSTGLCLGDFDSEIVCPILAPGTWEEIVCPILAPGTCEGTYFMSPTKVILNDIHNSVNGDGLPDGQLVETWHWKDEEEFAIVRKQLKDLEDGGKMETKFYTFVDEWNSTKIDDKFLSHHFPELKNSNMFRNMYPAIDNHYRVNVGLRINDDLAKLRKKLLDSYTRCFFTQKFLSMCYLHNLSKAKINKMVAFALRCGYPQNQFNYKEAKVKAVFNNQEAEAHQEATGIEFVDVFISKKKKNYSTNVVPEDAS